MSGHRNPRALYRDDEHKAELVARNALLQFDAVKSLVAQNLGGIKLTPATLCSLQGFALQEIYDCAGGFRDFPVNIGGTSHVPPKWEDVPGLVDEMCDYVNGVADQPIHAASYIMWRVNWIHPFGGGNGRTSRAASYLVLCCGLHLDLPGTITVPEMIVNDRRPYYFALDMADAAWRDGAIDVRGMEALLSHYLTMQLTSGV